MARRFDSAAACFQVRSTPAATGTDMVVSGEIDASTAAQLLQACERASGEPCDHAGGPGADLRVDLSQVSFCDVVGLNALLAARRAAASRGCRLTYTNLPARLARLISLAGVERELL